MLDADSSDLDNTSLNSGSDEDVGDDDSIMFDMDGPPQTLAHMAELSAAEVAHLDEDEDDEEQDIFDDGVGSDAVPDSDSEDSSIYEELEELDSMVVLTSPCYNLRCFHEYFANWTSLDPHYQSRRRS